MARCQCFGSGDAVYIQSASTAAWSEGEKATKEGCWNVLEDWKCTHMILNPINGEVKHETTSQIGAIGILIRVHHYVLLCIYSAKKRLPTTELTDCASTFGCREPVACCPDALSCTGNYCDGGWWRMLPRKSCWNAFNHLIHWNLTSTLEFTGKFTRRVSLNAHRISEVWKIMEVSDIGMLWLRCAFTAVAMVSFISYFPGALLLGIDLNSLDVDSLLGPLARSQGKWNRKKWSRQTHKSQS